MDRERRVNGDYNLTSSSSGDGSSVGVGVGGLSYIQHPVSRFDTLAGVAIRYGVEVADIKRINGLVSDLQMYALKTLHIPLPGRHPPSPVLSLNVQDPQRPSSSEQTSSSCQHSDLFDSFQSLKLKSSPQPKVSPAMSSLQGYYGLKPTDQKGTPEFEMAVYQKGGSHYLEDGPFKSSPLSNPPLSLQRKSKSVANGFMSENGFPANLSTQDTRAKGSDRWFEKLIRRRQKSETDFTRTPEMMLKENSSNGGGFSALAGKGLALRSKAANRTFSGADAEASSISPIPIGLGDSFLDNTSSIVRKSSSTSNLQDSDSSALSSLWSTSKWNLKPDFQAISTAAITKPIFDGLPKPITGRRNKAALD